MSLPQAAPGEGPKRQHEPFSYWSIKRGETHHAYIAGPCQWFVMHTSERSKPCAKWMTESALECKGCVKKKEAQVVGYLPVYRDIDWRPKLLIVYAPERQWTDKFTLHQRVILGRENDRAAQVWVRVAPTQHPMFTSTLPLRQNAVDITETLLTLWDIAELTAWYRCRAPQSDNAVSLEKPKPVTSQGEEFGDMTRAAAQKHTAPDPTETEALYNATVNRIKERVSGNVKPSANGRPKGEG